MRASECVRAWAGVRCNILQPAAKSVHRVLTPCFGTCSIPAQRRSGFNAMNSNQAKWIVLNEKPRTRHTVPTQRNRHIGTCYAKHSTKYTSHKHKHRTHVHDVPLELIVMNIVSAILIRTWINRWKYFRRAHASLQFHSGRVCNQFFSPWPDRARFGVSVIWWFSC